MPLQIIEVIIGISLLIFLHELGHFVAARLCSVRVDAFSLGFGPALLKWTRGATEYKLCCIPLGGYVKLAGETSEDDPTGAADELLSKPPGQRAFVFASGVLMNVVFAVVAFIIAFSVGVRFTPTRVGIVERGSPAWVEGIEPGDIIRKVNGKPISDFEDFLPAIAFSRAGESLSLEIQRGGQRLVKHVVPEYDDYRGLPRIGVQYPSTMEIEEIHEFDGKCPARDAGLQVRDKILEANGPVHSWPQLKTVLLTHAGKPVKLKVERSGKVLDLTVVPATSKRWMIGLSCQSTKIKAVQHDSTAYRAGLRAGDRIVEINGQPVKGWSDVIKALASNTGPAVAFAVQRAGQRISGTLTLAQPGPALSVLADLVPKPGLVIDSVIKGLPAEKIGLLPGDKVLRLEPKDSSRSARLLKAVNGDNGKLNTWDDLVDAVADGDGKTLLITYERDGREYVQDITPEYTDRGSGGRIGITMRRETVLRRYGLGQSIWMGLDKSVASTKQIYLTLRGLATRRVAGKNVGGIVAIAQASYYKAKEGLTELLYLLGIISVNLAVLNALPIPVLDGGHLLFLAIEKLKGSPVNRKIQAAAYYVGLALLLTLLAYAMRNDIMRLLQS